VLEATADPDEGVAANGTIRTGEVHAIVERFSRLIGLWTDNPVVAAGGGDVAG